MKKETIISLILLAIGLGVGFVMGKSGLNIPVASVAEGNSYYSTTTPINGYTSSLIKSGYGTLGSVVITVAGTNSFILYDTTTTDAIKRSKTTSSLPILAVFPASVVAGTYTFDTTFNDGLLLNVVTLGTGTSTITYRQ